MMRPFPRKNLDYQKKIFNYRLSRARRCIESAFGILATRWRVLLKAILCYPSHTDSIVMACVCLHNFLMAHTQESFRNENLSNDFTQLIGEDNYFNAEKSTTAAAYRIREELAKYFVSPEGEVSWQKDYVERGIYKDNTY